MRTKEISPRAIQREGIQERFDWWRRTPKRCSRIPEDLWSSAVEMAREQGLNRTASTLRLSYYALKKRLASADGTRCEAPANARFLELLPQRAGGHSVVASRWRMGRAGR